MIFPNVISEFLQAERSHLLRRTRNHQTICEAYPLGQLAEFDRNIDNAELRVWCICRAIYYAKRYPLGQIPTIELIEAVKKLKF